MKKRVIGKGFTSPGIVLAVELPPPDKKLHAHAAGGWKVKSEKTGDARGIARVIATDVRNRLGVIPGVAAVEYEFHFCQTNRDIANLIQSCKPYIDGVVDAGVIEGDSQKNLLIAGAVFFKSPRDKEKVILRFCRAEDLDWPRMEDRLDKKRVSRID